MHTFASLFTSRQLVALTKFSDLVAEARGRVEVDAMDAGLAPRSAPLHQGGTGAAAYADAVATYLALWSAGLGIDAPISALGICGMGKAENLAFETSSPVKRSR